MKILIANLGSTSLKYRLFQFEGGQETLLARGGFERVTDYPRAIEDCLAELKKVGSIRDEGELAAVGFKTIMARGLTGCVLAGRGGGWRHGSLQRNRARPQPALHHRHSPLCQTHAEHAVNRLV